MSLANAQSKKSVLPAIGLFFLAPLVAEYLLGNLPITMLPALVLMAPLYGGGALLIRELVRRAGRGWPSIVLLALAYGILEEGFTTQSLFNPNYLSLNLHLLQPAYIPALGIGGWWTVFVLALHTVWSICVPIALVEATVRERATTPWLGRLGLGVAVFLFALGVAGTTWMGLRQDRFVASPAQLASAAVAIVCLAVAAFLLPRPGAPAGSGFIPNPWFVGAMALVCGSAILMIPPRWGWWAVSAILVIEVGMAAAVLVWARRAAWSLRHRLALAGGAALAYAWHSFIGKPVVGGTGVSVRVGNAVFALGALAVIAFAAKRSAGFAGEARD
jgi:hypothetical protein